LPPPGESTGAHPARPDIHVILLDGYPRADTLERLFDFDNGRFVRGLETLGFEVADASRSNYAYTPLTLASMLHMSHLEDLDRPESLGGLRAMINATPVFDELRSRGYDIVSTAVPWEQVSLRNADFVCGDSGLMSDFELHVTRATLVAEVLTALVPDWEAARHRDFVRRELDCIEEAASGTHGPRLTLAHVASPHLPIVFGEDGSPASPELFAEFPDGFAGTRDEYVAGYVDQLGYVNGRLLDILDRVVQRSPTAVVIVMSDHGSESRFVYDDALRSDVDERFGVLFAARTPGHDSLFDDDVSLVNTFPNLMNAYFEANYAELPDRFFISNVNGMLDLIELEDPAAR
jgi:hypothetical protein